MLIDREVIFAEDVERIFGKRPWTSRSEEIMAANAQIEAEKPQESKQLESKPQQTSDEKENPEEKPSSDESPQPEEEK